MTELKTLKDFKTEYPDDGEIILMGNLKDEAVKWVKHFYNPNKTTMEIKEWINFFNITEDDLK